jgi:hypothetical protein
MGLDLSGRVGDLVLSENDLSDYVSIKSVLLPLFDNPPDLRDALNEPTLFTLSKLRNVLVHRGGIADLRFEKETGGRWKAGDAVTIGPTDIDDYIRVTSAVVERVLAAARKRNGLPEVTNP